MEPILRDRHANTEIVGEAPDVLGDPDRLKQAVTNLVENASRFIEPDGHITIELFGLKGNSILAVKDDGTGFGDIDPQLLFDRFYRTDASRSRGTGGTGLGLAIVKSVVESHDGTVEAINLPDGRGVLHHRAAVHPARRTLTSSNTQIRDRPIAIPDLIASAHAARDSESQRLVRGGMRMTLPAAEQHERQHGNHHDAGADGAHRLQMDHRDAHSMPMMYGTSHASHTNVLNVWNRCIPRSL